MNTNRKATFVLPQTLLDDMRTMVESGLAESVSALVRESLEGRIRLLREELLRREFEEAARDPMFMADLEECMRDFSPLDGEALG